MSEQAFFTLVVVIVVVAAAAVVVIVVVVAAAENWQAPNNEFIIFSVPLFLTQFNYYYFLFEVFWAAHQASHL